MTLRLGLPYRKVRAHQILDRARAGYRVSKKSINFALRELGDLL